MVFIITQGFIIIIIVVAIFTRTWTWCAHYLNKITHNNLQASLTMSININCTSSAREFPRWVIYLPLSRPLSQHIFRACR